MKHKLMLTFIFVIFLFSIVSVSAADDFNSLNDEISSENATVMLENDYTFNESGDNHFTNGINIDEDNLIIDGNNHAIDGKNMARIFNVTAANVTLANIQFKNAFSDNTGAVSYITGDNVRIINCSFKDNHANIEAGAIYLIGNGAYIHNCSFINNSAKYTGAILIRSHNGRICDSYFERNTAQISAAAIGLAFRNNTSIENCIFVRNGAYNEGGAAIFVNNALNTKIINSTFQDNFAHYYGGAIFWSRGHNGSVINSTFINNTATEKGGAIYHLGDDITLTDNLFNANHCVNGSAIYLNNGTNIRLSKNLLHENDIYLNNINDLEVIDSVILDEIISKNSTGTFKNNWFGNTKDNYNESFNGADNWLYLNATSDNAMVGQDTLIKFHFDQYNSSESFDLPEIALKLSGENIILAEDTVLIDESVNAHVNDYGAYVNASFENITFKYELPTADINVFADNVTKYYGNPQSFIVTLLDSKANPVSNKTVNIRINGVEYLKTSDENGSASIGINLNSGEYNVTVCVDNITLYSKVTVLPTIDSCDVIKVFKNESQYYAAFNDINGNILANANVTFNINGISYVRTSDDNGRAKLNINLMAGEYLITALNPLTGEMHSNNITVLSRFSENSDLVKYYRNDSQYCVKVIGDDGNHVGAGENVTFNINGVLYTRTTNESGHAILNINLGPGEYIITVEYKTCMVSNNITVKPLLFANNLNMSYRDGSKFTAHLLDGEGMPYANQSVNFNIKGVFYKRTTDVNGDAKLNINLMPGEYIITSSYNGYNIANKITVS